MALVLGDLYVALREAGASEATAGRAAAEVLEAIRAPQSAPAWPADAAKASVSHLVLVYMCGIAAGLTAALLLR